MIRILSMVLYLFAGSGLCSAAVSERQKLLDADSKSYDAQDRSDALLWQIAQKEGFADITDATLAAPYTPAYCKATIKAEKRRIVLFQFPSGDLQVKGYVSYVPSQAAKSPVLFYLRGGTGLFGVGNPANYFSCYDHYTVIGTSYRDGVSPGRDEYGGEDVNDVGNLIAFFPELAKRYGIGADLPKFLMGESRGGLQMFLALNRNPELQRHFKAIVSLSGLLELDPKVITNERPDLLEMFEQDFGLNSKNAPAWFAKRNPLGNIEKLGRDLPIIIVQGDHDIRVSTQAGKKMVGKLLEAGHRQVHYYEIEGADHGLANLHEKASGVLWKILQAYH